MAYGRRSTAWLNWTAALLATTAVYAILFGVAADDPGLLAIGVSAVAVTVLLAVGDVLWHRRPRPVHGHAQVLAASEAPAEGAYGECRLELFVEAADWARREVVVDSRVPVDKWPVPGDVLPVRVTGGRPRVRILWPQVLPPIDFPAADLDLPTDELDVYDDPAGLTYDEVARLELAGPRRFLPLEPMPSPHVARYLFPTERYRGEWRRHWIHLGRGQFLTLLLAILGIVAVRQYVEARYVTDAIAAICAAGGLVAGHLDVSWYLGRFALTNKRLLVVEGTLRRTVSSMALPRITDLRYQQSVLGRVLGYGDFVLEGARFLSLLRRIRDLPHPNELYLQIVEELYEPEAAEARRSGDLSVAIRAALYGPALSNYDGWVSVEVLEEGVPLAVGADRQFEMAPGREYELVVSVGSEPVTDVAERVVVTDGVDQEVVEFTVEVDSDLRAFRRTAQTVWGDGAPGRFTLTAPDDPHEPAPWLWVRVSQQRRHLQSIELVATGRAMLEHG